MTTAKKVTKKNSSTPVESRSDVAHKVEARPVRVPYSAGYRLAYPEHLKDPEFYYHWFEDTKGHVERAISAEYQYVKDSDGNKVVCHHENIHYLMRLPMEYRKADLALKKENNVNTLKKKIEINEEAGEYAPSGSGDALQRDDDFAPK